MADAAYVIEIASQVSGVGATTSELDLLASALDGSGANAAFFDDALATLAAQLNAAKGASAAANAALTQGQEHYAVLEKAAVKAAQGVERMAPASRGYGAAEAAAAAAEGAARAYAGELDNLERAAEDAAASQAKLESTMAATAKVQQRVNDKLGDAATNFSTFRGALGNIGGPLGEFAQKLTTPGQAFVDLNQRFGKGTAIAMVAGFGLARVGAAVIGVFVKMAAAVAVVTAAIVGSAFAASNAARKVALVHEAAAIATPALAGIPWREITNATGLADDALSALAKALVEAKVSAADLPTALRAAATAEAALGAGGAASFIADMKAGKLSAAEFADTIETKFGGVVARQLLGIEAQGARFKRNVGELFEFDIDPALQGLSVLVGLFDKNSSSGKAMRAALTGIMDPIIDNAKAAGYAIEAFVLGLMISGLEIYIALKPVIDSVEELLGIDTSGWDFADVLDAAATAGEIALPVFLILGVVLGVLGAAILAVIAVLAGMSAVFMLVPVAITAAVWAVGAAVIGLYMHVSGAVNAAIVVVIGAAGRFMSACGDMVAGLVAGIKAAAPKVLAAITGVVGSAVAAAKSALGINSPSTVMRDEVGANLGDGVVVGVKSRTNAAHAAIAELTDPSANAAHAAVVAIPAPQVNAAHAAIAERTDPSAATSPGASTHTSTVSTTSNKSNATTSIVIERLELPNVTDRAAFLAWLEGLALQGAAA